MLHWIRSMNILTKEFIVGYENLKAPLFLSFFKCFASEKEKGKRKKKTDLQENKDAEYKLDQGGKIIFSYIDVS